MSKHKNNAVFQFKGSLKDFADSGERQVSFSLHPFAKDLIESCGVPHVEIFGLEVNGKPAVLDYNVKDQDRLTIYPKDHVQNSAELNAIKPIEKIPHKFIADVHLGKLARLLRLTGMDTAYSPYAKDAEIAKAAVAENRSVLTRDVGLLKHGKFRYGYWPRSTAPDQQILEVIRYFDLSGNMSPFSRCINCNGYLEEVEMENVEKELPPRVKNNQNTVKKCSRCNKLYWKGTHYDQLVKKVEKIMERL